MNSNKAKIPILLLCFLSIFRMEAKEDPSDIVPIDGPYVFLNQNEVEVNYINLEKNQLVVRKYDYPSKSKTPILNIGIDKSSRPSFKVTLAKEIKVPPAIYKQPQKLLALSDIEGNFEALVETLQGNGVIDEQYRWIYGDGHLVLVGDFFDRGINVTACLWLIYQLDQEALLQGGRVHFIVGNHEEMNMRGQLDWLKPKYKKVAEKMGMPYIKLYGENAELGRWLRKKNIIEKIGSTIYVHGGISPIVAQSGLSIKDLNELARKNFGLPYRKVMGKGERPALVFHTKIGPMWYRGYFNDRIDESALTIILQKYKANKIVVGHTVVEEVCSYYNDKIIAIDVKHERCIGAELCNALLVQNGKFYKVNPKGKREEIGAGSEPRNGSSKMKPPKLKLNPIERDARILRAVREANKNAVIQYVEAGHDVNATYTTRKYTLLHYAIKNGQLDIVRYLIEKGADFEKTYEDQTALMYAIKHQRTKIIHYLIDRGASINARNAAQKTPIFFVAQYGTVNNARLLISKGALTGLKDLEGNTPLEVALKHENKDVAGFLRNVK